MAAYLEVLEQNAQAKQVSYRCVISAMLFATSRQRYFGHFADSEDDDRHRKMQNYRRKAIEHRSKHSVGKIKWRTAELLLSA